MISVPFFWLVASFLIVTHRPGFLLGCTMLAFQFDNLYNTTIIGPSLFVLFICTMAFIAFIQKRLFVLNIHDYLIISFGFLYVFAVVYSPDILAGIRISGRLALLGLGYYFIGRFLSSSHLYGKRYILDFGVSVLVLALSFGYLSVAQQESSARLVLGKGSAVGFSQMIDIAAGFSLFYLLSISGDHAWIKRIAMFIIFAGVIILLMFNATRGTVVSLVFAVCVYVAVSIVQWKPGSRNFTRILSLGFIIFGAFAVLLQFSTRFESLVFGLGRLSLNFGPAGIQSDTSSSTRIVFFRQAWDMFAEAPLFGQGIGSFIWNGKPFYPHNVFFELLAETGLIATTVFTVILVRTGWMAARLFRYPLPEATIVAGMFFVAAAHQQLSFALWMAKPLFFTMGVIASLHLRLEKSPLASSHPQRSANLTGKLLPNEHVK